MFIFSVSCVIQTTIQIVIYICKHVYIILIIECEYLRGATLNRRGLEKSNVGLEELLGSRFEELNVGLGVTSNRHESNGRRAKEEQRLDRWQSDEEQRRDNRC